MADYYPLIARAVAGADKNTAEGRRVLYERARQALVAQLRSVTPQLSESDITRERLALEDAIRKVEAETVRQARVDASRGPGSAAAPAPPREPSFTPPDDGRAEAAPPSSSPPSSSPPSSSPPPPEAPRLPSETFRDLLAGPTNGSRRSLTDSALSDFRLSMESAPELAGKPAVDRPPRAPSASPPEVRVEKRAEPREARDTPSREASPGEASFGASAPQPRPSRAAPPSDLAVDLDRLAAAPRPRMAEPETAPEAEIAPPPRMRSYRGLVVALIVLLVLGGLGAAAYWQLPRLQSLVQQARAPTPAPTRETTQQPTQPKISDRLLPGGQEAKPETGPQVAAVAQRVVLYEEDPNDPQGKRFVGSAIWRTESVPGGAGQPPELAIKADIEVPERRMGMTWSLRRNSDTALPASHTIEVMFKLPADFPSGGVANVPGVLMKQSEQARGVPLAGVAVKVTNGYFLIALYSVESERDRNIKLLKERSWFDIPIVYGNGRRAILAMEKGTPGERVFADAFAAWNQ